MLLDFDPLVTGMASQPFRLSRAAAGGKRVRHTPDFFVRRDDGTGLVVDVRPDERIGPEDATKFAVPAVLTCIPGDDIHSDGHLTTHRHRQSHPGENHWCPACSADGLTSCREAPA